MVHPVIEARGLAMRYGSLEAVRGIDLEVAAGEVFAFLGPNGAGKTTTVEIFEGYRRRSAGLDLPDLAVARPSLEDVYLALTADAAS